MSSVSSTVNYDHLLGGCFRSFPPMSTSHNGISRTIYKYILEVENNNSKSINNNAALKIVELLERNRNLIPTFEFNKKLKNLQELISANPVLTINGNAVCLSKEAYAPAGAESYCDDFFSQSLLVDPIKCRAGHVLERSRAEFYVTHSKGKCPAGHEMGEMQEDASLKAMCVRLKGDLDEEEKKNNHIDRTLSVNMVITKSHKLEISRLFYHVEALSKRRLDRVSVAGDVSKVGLKLGARNIMWKTGKLIGGKSAAKAAVGFAKYIPFVSVAVGLGLGCYRLTQGQFVKAGAEVTSGFIAIVPGVGTYLSVATDVGILVSDLKDATKKTTFTTSIQFYYDFLGVPSGVPTKEVVDQEIARITKVIENCEKPIKDKITKTLDDAKKAVYAHNHWQ